MRKLILVAFAAAAPTLAFAKPAVLPGGLGPTGGATGQWQNNIPLRDDAFRLEAGNPQYPMGTLGTGEVGGSEPGHVSSPGNTPVDNDSRAPVNDVDPGSPQSGDTAAAARPQPAP